MEGEGHKWGKNRILRRFQRTSTITHICLLQDYTVLMIAAASIILPTIAAITIFLPNERFFDPGRAQTHRGDVRGTPWKADGSDIKEANK